MPFAPGDLWLFAFSWIGMALVPAALGRAAWLFPAWFTGLGLFLLFAPPDLHPRGQAGIWLLLSQAPWILTVADLLARGRAARALDSVPLRALLAWSLLHLIGLRHVLAAVRGDLPAGFALEAAAGEAFTVLGAAFLWLFYRRGRAWFRVLALFWNAHALITSLALSTRILRAQPGLPAWGLADPEVQLHFGAWPNALDALFWIPLAIGLHAAVFYKLISDRAGVPRGAGNPVPGESPA